MYLEPAWSQKRRPPPCVECAASRARGRAREKMAHADSEPHPFDGAFKLIKDRGQTERPHPQKSDLVNLINLNCSG